MELPTSIAALEAHLNEAVRQALDACGATGAEMPGLGVPPRPELGDFCLGCFPLARLLRRAPQQIAGELAGHIEPDAVIVAASSEGPYLNFRIDAGALASAAIGEHLGPVHEARDGKPVLVEFSSPNTNKPQHLGHIRNNLLGDSISRILSACGDEVTRVNLINDRGIHICKSMLAYKLFGQGETPESSGIKGDHLVGDYYVRFQQELSTEYQAWLESEGSRQRFEAWQEEPAGHKALRRRKRQIEKAEKKSGPKRDKALAAVPDEWELFVSEFGDSYFNEVSELGGQAREMLRRWEEGDPEVRALWETMNGWVLDGFNATYDRLGIRFDHIDKESETYLLGKSLVTEGLERGLFVTLEDGAVACPLEQIGGQGRKVLLRSDGTSVYMTQDLGTAIARWEKFEVQRMVYVVADEQNYHFEVLFGILGLLREELKGACHHLSYGMVNLPSGKMKSREGTAVDADDLIDELHQLALEETGSRWPELGEEEQRERAEAIGLGALKYYILDFSPTTTMLFDPKQSIDFTGNTGPYNLYAYARTRSIFAKMGEDFESYPFEPEVLGELGTDEERALLQALYQFPGEVRRAASEYDPSKVTSATYQIAKAFSAFYWDRDKHPVTTCPDPALQRARLQLCRATGSAIRRGLGLLGIAVLEQM